LTDPCNVCCDGSTGLECSYYNDEGDFGGVYDCNGVCNGSYEFDDCLVQQCYDPICIDLDIECVQFINNPCNIGQCPSNINWNSTCIDCENIINGNNVEDCFGDCNGLAQIDDCGTCFGGNSGNIENQDKDCYGECFGFAFIDLCFECVGGTTNMEENWAMDCRGSIGDNNNDLIDDSCFGEYLFDNLNECCLIDDVDECGLCYGGGTGCEENGLSENYPNPFNDITTIQYSITENSEVSVAIYNLLGIKIKTLVDEFQFSGTYECIWDGKDKQGNYIPNDVYVYVIKTNNYVNLKRMTFIR